jgi:hypothetical protein
LHDVLIWMFHARGATSGGIYNRRPVRGGLSWSLHAVGRALDIMHPVGDPVGPEIALRSIRAAVALGVAEVIFNDGQKAWRWTEEKGTKRYWGLNKHRDHVHIGMTVDMADRPDTPELRHWFAIFAGA